jgi:5-methylthioadenosine/S-adenosylhomocysteine deaminase
MDTGNVDSVFVAGKALKRDGELIGVDLNHIRKLADESGDYVISKSGFKLSEF